MRKILITILTLITVLSLTTFCLTACDFGGGGDGSEATVVENGVTYTLNDEGTEYSVTAYESETTEVSILATVEGLPVTAIGEEAFRGQLTIKKVTLPTSVIQIGRSAFNGCKKLESINLEKVVVIGKDAFKGAFADGGINIVDNPPKVTLSSLQSLGSGAFNGCTKLREVDMQTATIDNIPEGCFSGCEYLFTVKLPASVKTVHTNGFLGDARLANINLENIEYFKVSCFESCGNLRNLVLTNAKDIRDRAFFKCSGVVTVTLGNKAERIYSKAFLQLPIATFTIGNASDFTAYYFEYAYPYEIDYSKPDRPLTNIPAKGRFSENNKIADINNPEDWATYIVKNQNDGCFFCTQKWLNDNGYAIGDRPLYGVIFNQP